MVNPVDPIKQALAQLRDIHMPKPVGWWPLAPGWYLLIILLIIALLLLTVAYKRYNANSRAKRQALRLLMNYEAQYERETDSQWCAANVSELLKRVALVYFPRAKVASLQGDEWLVFLTETAKGLDFNNVRVELLDLPYQAATKHDLRLLLKMARSWIKQRGKPCLN